ncbi:Hypothetical protein FKW44_024485 [Caligus rogercresseyi]|uniref:Uncharacterized protein n=1 Tax=Caligus rogercresseyi TaxID=217165 RepID=A0A7T8GMZ7_CALRO|nr:Hypothetical protein FKW44_024485 [Caligus rogercresseyi]
MDICNALRAFLGYLNYWSLQSDGNKLTRNEDKFNHFVKLSIEKLDCLSEPLRRKALEDRERSLKSKAWHTMERPPQ